MMLELKKEMKPYILFFFVAFIGLSQCEAKEKVLVMITSSDPDDAILSGTRYEYKFPKESDDEYDQSCAVELTRDGNLVVEALHPVFNEWDLAWESNSKQDDSNDLFYLHLQQTHGNLVIYEGKETLSTTDQAIWAAGTGKNGVDKLYMNSDCTLSLEDDQDKVIWKTTRTTRSPTSIPSIVPSISLEPSMVPSLSPSELPTLLPSSNPSTMPSMMPSTIPSISVIPTLTPSGSPSISMSPSYSFEPTNNPTYSVQPSLSPSISLIPSVNPSLSPSLSSIPTTTPSVSLTPSLNQSSSPSESFNPSIIPSISLLPTQTLSPSIISSSIPSQKVLKKKDNVVVVIVDKNRKNHDVIEKPKFAFESIKDRSYEYAESLE